ARRERRLLGRGEDRERPRRIERRDEDGERLRRAVLPLAERGDGGVARRVAEELEAAQALERDDRARAERRRRALDRIAGAREATGERELRTAARARDRLRVEA